MARTGKINIQRSVEVQYRYMYITETYMCMVVSTFYTILYIGEVMAPYSMSFTKARRYHNERLLAQRFTIQSLVAHYGHTIFVFILLISANELVTFSAHKLPVLLLICANELLICANKLPNVQLNYQFYC